MREGRGTRLARAQTTASYARRTNPHFICMPPPSSISGSAPARVPQGSVLGPLLFLVYIDGASNTVLHGKITMYADDIALYSIIKNSSDYTKGYYLSVFLVSYQPSDPKPYKVLLHAFL